MQTALLAIRKKFVKLGEGTQNTWLCSTKLMGNFLSNSALKCPLNLVKWSFCHTWNKRVLRLVVSRTFLCFSWNSCQPSLTPYSRNIFGREKNSTVVKTELIFCLGIEFLAGYNFLFREQIRFQRHLTEIRREWCCFNSTNCSLQFSIFVSPIYTFSMGRNIIVYTPSQSTNGEKYFDHISRMENASPDGKKYLFLQFPFQKPLLSHL